jgi:hypothetical protein
LIAAAIAGASSVVPLPVAPKVRTLKRPAAGAEAAAGVALAAGAALALGPGTVEGDMQLTAADAPMAATKRRRVSTRGS